MNNFKSIREIYGVTQAAIAEAIQVNRVTVANWENGTTKASNANLEKLSLFYGIGPEYFYDVELDDAAYHLLKANAQQQKDMEEKQNESKVETFRDIFSKVDFDTAMSFYMVVMKLLLASADSGDLDKLKTAAQINEKMGKRLQAIIQLREEEVKTGEPTLFDLLEKIDKDPQ